MYYLNARYYAPSVAGFITQDSYRGTYEDPKTWNLYAYCAGNHVGYTDPTGHFWDTVLDIYGALDSIKTFIDDPGWANGGLAVLDTLAALVPYVPGTGGVKAVRTVVNFTDDVVDDIADGVKGAKNAGNVIDAAKTGLKLSKKAVLKKHKLPTKGKIRFIPPKDLTPSQPLKKKNGGYVDKFGDVWIKCDSRTAGEHMEWDVQLSNKGRKQLSWICGEKKHLNVSLKGRITHK